MNTLIITGTNLKIEDVVNVARHGQKVELHPEAKARNFLTLGAVGVTFTHLSHEANQGGVKA